jgi:hypothetical protein
MWSLDVDRCKAHTGLLEETHDEMHARMNPALRA